MSNLLISNQMAKALFSEPAVADFYRTERIVPNSIIFFQRALAMAQSGTPATLKLLGRVLRVGTLALGYLQILRPPTTVQASSVLGLVKTSYISAANLLLTYAGDPQKTGTLQVLVSDDAHRALQHLEEYDPVHTHLVPFETSEGIKIHVEGDGVSLEDLQREYSIVDGVHYPLPSGIVLTTDILNDFEILISGIIFPVEVLNV